MKAAIMITYAFLAVGILVLIWFLLVYAIQRMEFDDVPPFPSPEQEHPPKKT